MAKLIPHLTVAIDSAGKAQIDFHDFTGTSCLDTGRQLHHLLAELGVTIAESQVTLKPEAFAAPALQVSQAIPLLTQEGGPADGR